MDIRKCYDSINIDQMIKMIKYEDFFEEVYIVHQFIKMIRSKRYIFSKSLKQSENEKEKEDFIIKPEEDDLKIIPEKETNVDLPVISKFKRDKFDKRGKILSIVNLIY